MSNVMQFTHFLYMLISYAFTFIIDRKRLPRDQWWLKLRPLLRILAKHDAIYTGQAEDDSK